MRKRFPQIQLIGVLALLVACTPDGAITNAPTRDSAQDINLGRSTGPSSATPGAPRDTRGSLPAVETEPRAEAAPPTIAEKAQATQPSLGIGGITQSTGRSGNPQTGRRFALDNCRPCHVVAPTQSSAARFANAPDFRAIAAAPSTTPMALTVWLTNPHPTMPSLVLSPQEASDVTAYILSLRTAR